MRIEYQLDLEDYRDALALVARSSTGAPPSVWERWQFLFLALAVAAIGFGAVVVDAILNPITPSQAPSDTFLARVAVVALLVFPWLVVQGLIWPVFCRLYPQGERRALRNLHLVGVVLLLASTLASSLLAPAPKADAEPFSWSRFVIGNLPLLSLVGLYGVTLARYIRGSIRRAWSNQQHEHLPRVVEIDDASLRLASVHSHTRYDWGAFLQFRESERQFVLHVGTMAFVMVPKRAFFSGEQIEQFRDLLRHNVGDAVPRGFDLASPPPLPGAVQS